MHKGYTINFFIDAIQNLEEKAIKKDFYTALSPRNGFDSDKSVKLDELLGSEFGDNTQELIQGKTARVKKLGKTAKQRLLTALRNRKNTGKAL